MRRLKVLDPLKTMARSQRRRLAKEEPARLDALLCARDDDEQLVQRLAITARRLVGPSIMQPAAFEPLAELCRRSALGVLPRTEWAPTMIASLQPTMPADEQPLMSMQDGKPWDKLLARLMASLPGNAHEERIRRALSLLPVDARSTPTLLMLMEGATSCGAVELQQELLDILRGVAPVQGESLLSVVQAPLLRLLGAPELRPVRTKLLDILAPRSIHTPSHPRGGRAIGAEGTDSQPRTLRTRGDPVRRAALDTLLATIRAGLRPGDPWARRAGGDGR